MADWMHASSTYLTNSGTDSNLQVIQFLIDNHPGLPVYIDEYIHASVPYAIRAAGRMDARTFRHNNVADLERNIGNHGPGLVCIDTRYSFYGDLAPIEDIVLLCKRTGCILMADEANALGVSGPNGSGVVPMLGLQDDVPIRTASLGKAFGAGGGIVAYNKEYSHLRHSVPMSTVMAVYSLAPQDARAHRFLKTLDLLESEEGENRRKKLSSKRLYFQKGCIQVGYDGPFVHGKGPIVSFITGNAARCKDIYSVFTKNGIFPSAFMYPVAPHDRSIIRWTVCTTISWNEIEATLEFLERNKDVLKSWTWPKAMTLN